MKVFKKDGSRCRWWEGDGDGEEFVRLGPDALIEDELLEETRQWLSDAADMVRARREEEESNG